MKKSKKWYDTWWPAINAVRPCKTAVFKQLFTLSCIEFSPNFSRLRLKFQISSQADHPFLRHIAYRQTDQYDLNFPYLRQFKHTKIVKAYAKFFYLNIALLFTLFRWSAHTECQWAILTSCAAQPSFSLLSPFTYCLDSIEILGNEHINLFFFIYLTSVFTIKSKPTNLTVYASKFFVLIILV